MRSPGNAPRDERGLATAHDAFAFVRERGDDALLVRRGLVRRLWNAR